MGRFIINASEKAWALEDFFPVPKMNVLKWNDSISKSLTSKFNLFESPTSGKLEWYPQNVRMTHSQSDGWPDIKDWPLSHGLGSDSWEEADHLFNHRWGVRILPVKCFSSAYQFVSVCLTNHQLQESSVDKFLSFKVNNEAHIALLNHYFMTNNCNVWLWKLGPVYSFQMKVSIKNMNNKKWMM